MQPIKRNRPVGASQKTGRSGQRIPREPFLSGLAVIKTITIKSRVGKVRAGDQLEPSLEDDWLLSARGFNRSMQHYDRRSSGEGCRPLRAHRGSANLPRVTESLGLSDTSTQQTAPSPRETFRCQNSVDTEGERQAEPASAAFPPPGFQGRPTIRVTPADCPRYQTSIDVLLLRRMCCEVPGKRRGLHQVLKWAHTNNWSHPVFPKQRA
ncbi:hypothetical protein OKW45_006217 [Paraburkholderia sp. WSM4175]